MPSVHIICNTQSWNNAMQNRKTYIRSELTRNLPLIISIVPEKQWNKNHWFISAWNDEITDNKLIEPDIYIQSRPGEEYVCSLDLRRMWRPCNEFHYGWYVTVSACWDVLHYEMPICSTSNAIKTNTWSLAHAIAWLSICVCVDASAPNECVYLCVVCILNRLLAPSKSKQFGVCMLNILRYSLLFSANYSYGQQPTRQKKTS